MMDQTRGAWRQCGCIEDWARYEPMAGLREFQPEKLTMGHHLNVWVSIVELLGLFKSVALL